VRLTFLKVEPLWRRLLADPRTGVVRRRVGLP